LILAAFAAPLTEVAFKFGPAEYFSLMILGLIGAVVLASGSLLKAVAMIVLGLLLGLVGTDVNSGVARFSFDIPELTDGIGFITIAMGVFGYGEIIANLSQPEDKREVFTGKVTGLFPTKEDFKNMIPAVLPLTPSRRKPNCVLVKCPSAKAIFAVWQPLSLPTTRVLKLPSFRCSPWVFHPMP